MLELLQRKQQPLTSVVAAPEETLAEVLTRPALKSVKVEPKTVEAKTRNFLTEYAELATMVGVAAPDLHIEKFRQFLFDHDLPLFALSEVIKYMDAKAEQESKHKAGWEWRPLREKDHLPNLSFGQMAMHIGWGSSTTDPKYKPATDWYRGTHEQRDDDGKLVRNAPPSSRPYDRTIPLHALRRIALIEKGFPERVAFFVSDYALAPAIQYPDPFLMAVIPNPSLANGTGRFVIDFWDEPGFGIEQMLK